MYIQSKENGKKRAMELIIWFLVKLYKHVEIAICLIMVYLGLEVHAILLAKANFFLWDPWVVAGATQLKEYDAVYSWSWFDWEVNFRLQVNLKFLFVINEETTE